MKMNIPSPVLHSLFALNTAGYEAYVVGGCVRDVLMGKEPFDWDITTSALPDQTKAVFAVYRIIDTGIQHGTVTVIVDDMPLEITTFRIDGDYSDGRHPDCVSFASILSEDLCRRDFTVNAMAYHPTAGMIDLYGGQSDVEHRVVRCVGDPHRRFQEDALRIIRGLRFAATLGFVIEETTAAAIHDLAYLLKNVAVERISVELMKLLCGNTADSVIRQFSDVLEVILPYDIEWNRVADRINKIEPNPLLRLATMLLDHSAETAQSICHHLRLSNDMQRAIRLLVMSKNTPLLMERSRALRLLNQLGAETLLSLIKFRSVYDDADYNNYRDYILEILQEDACYRLTDLAVNGRDLISIGIPAGPKLGKTLSTLLGAVMDGSCHNQHDDLLEYAKKNPVQ